ncbi:MAG: tRNA (adenosine(37)-N6)-threonylcarbamoyltransferase complex ATPase subunit type 1 TsaE [Gammaproteobacteria bacterium]|jgi:tRNA threonylcarbamoyladenosine biosynthesis protein TsaE|nr:tRNA (adenosine(37)-N6)-threonylcarbamoyltransferase complex ATPase subunit type 1 TsaE [Gammaproteobacteria bacterium]MDH3822041.1 tRNA (adenosine(37)-N6)-threonylcarbamoyltransferase complex ATPase subunit type 1 TsaE [Gammaproteobacteria bacterium]
MKHFLSDEAATIAFGQAVLDALPADLAGWTLLLRGELGAGKSTFARALIRAAGHEGPVPSPTYTLVEPYSLSRGNIYHVDLYRVSDEEELRYLGWNELDDGCRIVEWPDRAPGITDQADLSLTLTYDGEGRTADLVGLSDRGKALVSRLTKKGVSHLGLETR